MRVVECDDIVEALMLPRKLRDGVNKFIDISANLFSAVTNTTAKLTGMPGGGGKDRDSLCVNYVASKDTIETAMQDYKQARRDVARLLFESELTGRQRAVLCRYYLWFDTWKHIAELLNVSERTVYRDLEEAVCAADKVFRRWRSENDS